MDKVKEGYGHLEAGAKQGYEKAKEGYEKAKAFVKEELKSKNAKENIQMLLTVGQILSGFIIGLICNNVSVISGFLTVNWWIGGSAVAICILLPLSSNSATLCSSEFLRHISFYLFSVATGVSLGYFSLLFEDFFFALWLYLASALLMYYEFNSLGKDDLRKGFKFVVFGLFLISLGIEIIILFNLRIFLLVQIIVFFASILLSYALISSASAVDQIKRDSNVDRESMLEDNLIVWRNFPIQVVMAFPDFIRYLKEICVKKDISSLSN